MKLLNEITDLSLNLGSSEKLGEKYDLRKSARAVLINEEGLVATQYLKNYTFHKLPGGGVDPGETIETALQREVLEEVGCDSKILNPIGIVIEYRNKYNLLHISYCFAAKVVGEIGEPSLEEGEVEEGQVTLWLQPDTLLEKMKNDSPLKYEGHFILQREKSFITEYLKQHND